MRVFLHYIDKDFELGSALTWNQEALNQDLDLSTIFGTMAGGDEMLLKVAKVTILTSLSNDSDTIGYRQAILTDCLRLPELVRQLYEIAVDAIEAKRKVWYYLTFAYASANLSSAVGMMEVFTSYMDQLRVFAVTHGEKFKSGGFRRLLSSLSTELAVEYLSEVRGNLEELKFRWGSLLTAKLGPGNEGMTYSLRRPAEKRLNWWQRLFAGKPKGVYTFNINPRDESGARALSALRDTGVACTAEIMAGATEHVLAFFQQLQTELAFYLGCLNLAEQLKRIGAATCLPSVPGLAGDSWSAEGLYDPCLALHLMRKVIGNDVSDQARGLLVITGANQGGKTTFLRSVGVAQLMLQSGMFVAATQFSAPLCSCLFTHFKREEDKGMKSGKFDEEMARMNAIVDHLAPGAIGLFNESFAATNEREGSEIAGQILSALQERGIRVFFVTHLYAFADELYRRDPDKAVFLRAERKQDMERTFRLLPGEPLPTSYAVDIYNRLFPADKIDRAFKV